MKEFEDDLPDPEELESDLGEELDDLAALDGDEAEADPDAEEAAAEEEAAEAEPEAEAEAEAEAEPDDDAVAPEAESRFDYRETKRSVSQLAATTEQEARGILDEVRELDAEMAQYHQKLVARGMEEDEIAQALTPYQRQRAEKVSKYSDVLGRHRQYASHVQGLAQCDEELNDHPLFAKYPAEYLRLRTSGPNGRVVIPNEMPLRARVATFKEALTVLHKGRTSPGAKAKAAAKPAAKATPAQQTALKKLAVRPGGGAKGQAKPGGKPGAKPVIDAKTAREFPSLSKAW